MNNAIIDNDFKITSILLKNSKGMIFRLLKQFENRQVLLLQKQFQDYPCETIIINNESDLLMLLKATINEFDLLIIDNLDVIVKSKKLINFIKSISKMEGLKDKQVVLLFNCKTNMNDFGLDNFRSYKRVISAYSDRIYTIIVDNHHYFMKEIKTDETSVFRHY